MAAWTWARSEMRRRRATAIGLTLLIGVSGAVMLTAAAGARRTDSAFERFLDRSDAADVRVQYTSEADVDDDLIAAFRAHPDVEVAAPIYVTVAFTERSELDIGIFSGPDAALFRDIDRPRVVDGRLPDPAEPDEVFITRFAQREFDVEVGDTVRFATFSPDQFEGADAVGGEPAGPALELEVVGVATTPYDLADPEFAGVFATPAYHERYWDEVGGFGPSMQVSTRGSLDASAVAS